VGRERVFKGGGEGTDRSGESPKSAGIMIQ